MKGLPFLVAACAAVSLAASGRADVSSTFATNPLNDPSVVAQGPDAVHVNDRFAYNVLDHTLTAHYDSALATVKLLFPLTTTLTQDTSFSMSATFKILSAGFIIPPDYGASAPAFGLVNSLTTGNRRGSTTTADYTEVTPGNCYDMMTVDYYPTQDFMYGGNTTCLSTFQTQEAGVSFYSSGAGAYPLWTLPEDLWITTTVDYDALTRQAVLSWNGNTATSNLTGRNFSMDSFAITLWQDPSLAPVPPAVNHGSRVAADVVFSSFSVTTVPEPGTLALLACGTLALARRQRKRRT